MTGDEEYEVFKKNEVAKRGDKLADLVETVAENAGDKITPALQEFADAAA